MSNNLRKKRKKIIKETNKLLTDRIIEDKIAIIKQENKILKDNNRNIENQELLEKNEKEIEKIILKHKIVKKIEKNLTEKKNELEIINSNIYILNKITNEKKNINDIEEQQNKIKKLQQELQKIKDQLKIYVDSEVVNKAILLDDKSIIDDILNYKCMLDKEDNLKEDYELLSQYTYLVEQVDKVNDRCIELDNNNQKKLNRLNINEEKFRELEIKVIKEDETTELIKRLLEQQQQEIRNLEDDIDIIESKCEIIYNYDLLNKLMSLELEYLALLALSPLNATLPFIALTALTIKDMIKELSNKKLITEEGKIYYYAKDYANNLEEMSYKLNDMEAMMNATLYSITDIKEKFSENIDLLENPKYEDFLPKIEKIEDILKDSMSKIEIQKNKINKNKNKNKEKMKKVLELNRDNY